MKKKIYTYAGPLTFCWALVIFVLCATPGQYIPSAHWLDLLSFDKWVHATMFFILSALVIITAVKNAPGIGVVVLGIILCVVYGGLLEIMQAKCFSHRSADWEDFAANSFGCLMAFLLLSRIKGIFVK